MNVEGGGVIGEKGRGGWGINFYLCCDDIKNYLILLKIIYGNYVKNINKSDNICEKIVFWYVN